MHIYRKIMAVVLAGALSVSGITAVVGQILMIDHTYNKAVQEAQEESDDAEKENKTFLGTNYKEQLTANQKAIYEAFSKITPKTSQIEAHVTIQVKSDITLEGNGGFKSQEDVDAFSKAYDESLNDEMLLQAAVDAFVKDHPEVCWLKFGDEGCRATLAVAEDEEGKQEIHKEAEGLYKVETLFTCTTPVEEAYLNIDDPLEVLRQKVRAIIAENIKADSTDYEKVKVFYDYLCKNIKYDDTSVYAHEAYGGLVDGKCSCEGYAKAFKLLCDAENIPCVLVVGEGITSRGNEGHMWNDVKLEDGKWYAVDVTWDDINGGMHKYFLVGKNTVINGNEFFKTHIEKGRFSIGGKEFAYPDLCDKSVQ